MEMLWEEIKDRLKQEVPDNQFRMWIDPLELIQSGPEEVVLGCPSYFFLNWVRERYLTAIHRLAREMATDPPQIQFQVKTPKNALPGPPPQQFLLPGFERSRWPRLNENFTFDQFVTGPCNNFAFQASLALACDKNLHNNALFLFSTAGLGKTHLSQAVGHYIVKHKPSARVLYLSTEDFTNEMVVALKSRRMEAFKEKYRRHCDFLLLEEIHFLSGKDSIQEELGYTLDTLYSCDKKVIFTGSLPPKDIPQLGGKLKSRLSSALLGGIDPPDYQTRMGILERKSAFLGLGLDYPVKDYLASQPFKDVRQLEGCLIRMSAQSTLLEQPLDLPLAEAVVREQIQERSEVSIQAIKELVGKYFQILPEEMTSKSRKRIVLYPRNLSIYLSRKFTSQTLETIARAFNRDSTSVIHAVNTVEKNLKKNAELSKQVHFLSSQLEDFQKKPKTPER